MFLRTGCSLLRAEGFSCSLGVLYGGLGISKLQFLIKKIEVKFPALNFFSILGHQTLDPDPGSGSGIRIRNKKKCWIRIRIKSMRIRNPEYKKREWTDFIMAIHMYRTFIENRCKHRLETGFSPHVLYDSTGAIVPYCDNKGLVAGCHSFCLFFNIL
jgi:hypothetical protein